ncbi:FAD-dependent monooxygenase [Bradyrhizobium jicamae]|uniref:FAD-dependent monooxygenase n=1 Tax=Bradyrhizobium jicamae TaxID=280332 RepID=A0ABS5FDV7_9BRAD|nr:FAD-dependent monooxygenase [Bradyrhizobium jicamae]MBR0794965.1 FAD-dependent monooxygenase [Bradyrhizobium jicamae]
MSRGLQIAIVGGGIGGLTTSLALRARGLSVTVFEQADELREIGAGVTIYPNAMLLLNRLGLADEIEKIGCPITGQVMRTSTGELINASTTPSTSIQSYNVHRADFLKLLANAQPKATLHLGHRLSGARETDGRVCLSFSNGATVNSDVVIGADGIHSALQREIGLKTYPSSEEIMAYRGLIPTDKLSWAKDIGGRMSRWIGKGRSFLCYPVSSGRLMNMVAFVPTNLDSEESWTAPGDLKALSTEYAGWDDPVLETIGALDSTFRWGIYDRAPLPYWCAGRAALLGDAAHAMVPHLGQGAAQAIEDGFTLAAFLEGAKPKDVSKRLKAYERTRLERTSQIQALARETGRFFRAEYDDVAERDRFIAKWMAANGQIRGHDAENAAKEALLLAKDSGSI